MDRLTRFILALGLLPGRSTDLGGFRTYDLTDYETASSPGRSTPPGLLVAVFGAHRAAEARVHAS
jgi:hypothetical protein